MTHVAPLFPYARNFYFSCCVQFSFLQKQFKICNAIKLLRDEIVRFWTPLPLSSSCKRCETPEFGRGTSLYCNNEQCSPGKYIIKRKLRLESNTWQWQRLRIRLNSMLIQGKKSFSLLKRILHYTRCTMTESRLKILHF